MEGSIPVAFASDEITLTPFDDEPMAIERVHRLTVVFEAENIVSPTRGYTLDRRRVLIGRDGSGTDADLIVGLRDRTASRRHVALTYDPHLDGYVFEDLRSKGGTRLNGTSAPHGVLENGDVIGIGRSFVVYSQAYLHPSLDGLEMKDDESLRMAIVRQVAELAAQTDEPVVLTGETGSGKEYLARQVCVAEPFVAKNCAGLRGDLAISEIFGHVRGAFSGATHDRLGVIALAEGGTLVLDEIAELPEDVQAMLLRVLQDYEYSALGSDNAIKANIRLIAMTHEDLPALVEAGRFRADLLKRIAKFLLRVPALRERREEILALFMKLAGRRVKLTRAAAQALLLDDWSGNVRDLEGDVAKVMLCKTDVVDTIHLPERFASKVPRVVKGAPTRVHLLHLMERFEGNAAQVARTLGRPRSTVLGWLKQHGLKGETSDA